jgi:hypothetical protein
MAIIQCPIHGHSGVAMVCAHIHQSHVCGDTLRTFKVDRDDILLSAFYLCHACHSSWKALESLEAQENFIGNLAPVCGRCFDPVTGPQN